MTASARSSGGFGVFGGGAADAQGSARAGFGEVSGLGPGQEPAKSNRDFLRRRNGSCGPGEATLVALGATQSRLVNCLRPDLVSPYQEDFMKVVSDTSHGILDYVTVALFALAPTVFGLTGTAALISYALAGIHLAMTVLTDMPLGIVKIIPFKLHAIVEMLVGPVLVIGALAFPDLVRGGQAFFIAAGFVIMAVWATSHYGALPMIR